MGDQDAESSNLPIRIRNLNPFMRVQAIHFFGMVIPVQTANGY